MKNELFKGIVFHDIDEVKATVTVAVEFYNNERPHMSIDIEIAKRWTRYRLIAIKSRQEGSRVTGNGLPLPGCQEPPSGKPFQSTSGRDKVRKVNKCQA
jgi:hypothetical protein